MGEGIAGLTLTLCLHSHIIRSIIYEFRPSSFVHAGAIMLSPDSLELFNKLGIYARIWENRSNCEWLGMKINENISAGKHCVGSEECYGYKALRIYRRALITELRAMCQERRIDFLYSMKYQVILEEGHEGVKVEFAD